MASPWEKYQQPDGPWSKYQEPQGGTIEGLARAGAAGTAEGVGLLAGTVGDVNSLGTRAFDWAGRKLGLVDDDPARLEKMLQMQSGIAPTSEQVIGAMQNATRPEGGQSFMEYQPQTTGEEFAKTAGQFLPGAIIGPGSKAVKAASWAGGALGSEAAGQFTEGTAYEPYARAAGAILGGGIPAAMVQKVQRPSSYVPSTQQYQKAKTGAYKQAEASGNTLSRADFAQIVDDLGNIAVNSGANKRLTPNVRAALKALDDRVKVGGDLSVAEIDTMRQTLKMGEEVMRPQERHLIRRLVSEYDKRVDAVVPVELKEARRLNVRYKRGELMDDVNEAVLDKAGQFSQSGTENALRSEYRKLARSKRQMRQFDAEERAAIRRVGRGGRAENAARMVSKLAPTSALQMLPGIMGGGFVGSTTAALTGNPILGAAVGSGVSAGTMGLGIVGKKVATALTSKNARIAEELIRAGKGGAATARALRGEKKLEAITRALLAARMAQLSGPVNQGQR